MSTKRDHLDAETVAAWMDGGLDAASLAAAEAHASNCERCQELLATVVKTMPEAGTAAAVTGSLKAASISSRWWRWWMAPIGAAAAAVTLWMVVPQEQLQQKAATAPAATEPGRRSLGEGGPMAQATPPPPSPAPQEFKEKDLKRQTEVSAPAKPAGRDAQPKLGAAAANVADATGAKADAVGTRPGAPATRTLRGGVEDRRDNKADERVARLEAESARAPAAPPAAAAPAEPAAAREAAITQLRKQTGPLVFVSPDPRFRWRATADGIERSEDSGRTWFTVRLPQGEIITAGSSPGPLTCWVVGRRGVVLVATDGTNFTRIPFPEAVDLTAVTSPELRIATVTTADGRVFHTENAGRTWQRQ